LEELHVGDVVEVEAPMGHFTLPQEDLPVVFLVGGIGITPIRSMLKQLSYEDALRTAYLFYSNHRPEDAAFLTELETLPLRHYHFIPTMTEFDDREHSWVGETGYIDGEKIEKYVREVHKPMYLVVGPPGFVDGMMRILETLDIASTRIRSEDFTGY
jgi:ferredoxin-NADP reductase